MRYLLLMVCTISISLVSYSQRTFTSSCGYSITVSVEPLQIITSGGSWGYNYDVLFRYNVVVNGSIPNGWCGGGEGGSLFNLQARIICYENNNSGSYNLPKAGGTGYITTTTNQAVNYSSLKSGYSRPSIDKENVTPEILRCNKIEISISGPGIPDQTVIITPNQPTPLPVELVTFDVRQEQNHVEMNWLTASEKNNDFFTVERTKDGIHFEEIGHVKGAGNSSLSTEYSFKDYTPSNGISYYRIKQTDFNGREEIFEAKSIHFISSGNDVKVYPNPSINDRVSLLFQDNNEYTVNIYSYTGQLIDTFQRSAETGNLINDYLLPEGNAFIFEFISGQHQIQRLKVIKG